MSLLPSTKRMVERLESLSGIPVHIMEDPELENLADIKIARGSLRVHLLSYRPSAMIPADYLIAYQCGLALRTFELPLEKQFAVGNSREGLEKLNLVLLDRKLPSVVRGMGEMLLMGLITQLRSYPLGLRVDSIIRRDCPDLHEQQVKVARVQLAQNIQAIQAATSGYLPAKVTRANFAMNAAFAAYWSGAWSEPPLTLPYKAAGMLDTGEALLSILDSVPDSPENDKQLIDAWAEELGLRGWYQYVARQNLNP